MKRFRQLPSLLQSTVFKKEKEWLERKIFWFILKTQTNLKISVTNTCLDLILWNSRYFNNVIFFNQKIQQKEWVKIALQQWKKVPERSSWASHLEILYLMWKSGFSFQTLSFYTKPERNSLSPRKYFRDPSLLQAITTGCLKALLSSWLQPVTLQECGNWIAVKLHYPVMGLKSLGKLW